jgi:hypothetical protein
MSDRRKAQLLYVMLPYTDSEEINAARFQAGLAFLEEIKGACVGESIIPMAPGERYGDIGMRETTMDECWPFSERNRAVAA